MTRKAQGVHESMFVHAGDRWFSRRIDVGYNHHVRIFEAVTVLLQHVAQAIVAARLNDSHDLAGSTSLHIAGSSQCGCYLRRVASVVVDDPHTSTDSYSRESPLHTGKPFQPFADVVL